MRKLLPTPVEPWSTPLARTWMSCCSRRKASSQKGGAKTTVQSAKPGQRLAPQRVLSARSRSGDSRVEAVVVIAGTQLGVEVFVAGGGLAKETVAPPQFDASPVDRIEPNRDHLATEVSGDFPQTSPKTDGRVFAHAAFLAHEKQPLHIGVFREGAQADPRFGEAVGRALILESGVSSLM